MATIRRLGIDDTAILGAIASEAGDFDIEGRTDATPDTLSNQEAHQFLRNPDILFWVAEEGDDITGFLLCFVQYLWHAPAREVMLYEIGVRRSARRRGIGRSLVETMESWMRRNQINDVWVPADNPGAEAFYHACGFQRDDDQAVMMSKSVR